MMTCGAFSIFNSSLKLIKEKIMMCDENTIFFFLLKKIIIFGLWEWGNIFRIIFISGIGKFCLFISLDTEI